MIFCCKLKLICIFGANFFTKILHLIFGIGTDIIEVARIKTELEKVKGLREKLFTPGEIEYCENKKNHAQHYAARFCAKEALFKAFGTGWRNGFAFHEIEVVNNELGKPEFRYSGKVLEFIETEKLTHIHLSVTHVKELANALVIIEKL